MSGIRPLRPMREPCLSCDTLGIDDHHEGHRLPGRWSVPADVPLTWRVTAAMAGLAIGTPLRLEEYCHQGFYAEGFDSVDMRLIVVDGPDAGTQVVGLATARWSSGWRDLVPEGLEAIP
jgi:hypothetical protein